MTLLNNFFRSLLIKVDPIKLINKKAGKDFLKQKEVDQGVRAGKKEFFPSFLCSSLQH
jgi:hypothetical protein